MADSSQLGLKKNWRQFSLLVLVNAFVGGMVGMERTILPAIAEVELGVATKTAIFSFIIVFGISKALANYLMGKMANRIGRKQMLLLGWIIGLPVPLILMYAPDWSWVVFANVLLGINQGLTWSSTVIMKIDLVGQKDRGLAMGINEFAGYLSVGLVAIITGWIASQWGLRPAPFWFGLGIAVCGLLSTVLLVKDTHTHYTEEAKSSDTPFLRNLFLQTSLLHRNLGSISIAGLVNNLNDGMMWGLLPIFLITKGYTLAEIGLVAGVYPMIWGIGQLFTGKMGDHFCKKDLLYWGMLIQALALAGILYFDHLAFSIFSAAVLGLGTALVYPNFLSGIADALHPHQRAESIGIFRMWRDLGYAIGALLTGIITDILGMNEAFWTIILLTFGSALLIKLRMYCVFEDRKRLILFPKLPGLKI